jgi:3-phenylpropionate/trans-cinnamate dioxygenase ferredoxin subunit
MSENWKVAATEAEFADKDRKLIDFGGEHQIGLFKLDDGYYAISAWCSHQKASMMQGEVEDGKLMCPLHGAWFSIRNGDNLTLPAVKPVPSYPVKVEDGKIWIDV